MLNLKSVGFAALVCSVLLPCAYGDAPVTAPLHHKFVATEVATPDGGTVGLVQLINPDDQSDNGQMTIGILRILADAGSKTKLERAQIVAQRLQDVCDKDPMFYEHLKKGYQNKQVVLSLVDEGNDYVLTADENSMRVKGARSKEAYAQYIINDISDALSGVTIRDASFDYQLTGEKKTERAAKYCEAADAAFAQGDYAVAENKYKLALKLAPDYAYCGLHLAGLYTIQKENDKARQALQQVLVNNPDPTDKTEAQTKLQQLGG